MKNTAIDILGYEERKKDNKLWFDESVDNFQSKRIRHNRHIQLDRQQQTEQNIRRNENGRTQHVKRKGQVINQKLIAIEQEFKERNV